jgi:hypothetical protein
MWLTRKTASKVLIVLALIPMACSSSSTSSGATPGPNCLALEHCCNQISGVPDGGKLEAEDCDSTSNAWTTESASAAEATCESALKQYQAKDACPK